MKKLLLIPLPSVMIGALAMYENNVPPIIWGQNLLGFLISLLLSSLIIRKPKIINNDFSVPIATILLLFTFIDSGLEGVHRWISIGPIRFYITSIVLPLIIIGLGKRLETINWWLLTFIITVISIIIAFQPDASQLTAFIISMSVILFSKRRNNYFRYVILGLFSVIALLSWLYLDRLEPVSYVENIVRMVAGMGILWHVLGIISLVILPLPFIIFPPQEHKVISISLGIYYTTVLLSTMLGNFPVPLMGYGISPILGYFIGLTWLISYKADNKTA